MPSEWVTVTALPLGIGDADMGRAGRFGEAEPFDLRDLAALDRLGMAGGIGLVGQPVDRHIDKAGIADEVVLVRGRDLHRLGDHAHVVRAVVTHGGEVEVLQNVQHLDQHDAAAGRPVGREGKAAIAAPERIAVVTVS